MKVLMFGWEFPPHISGGLGTACAGLTSALEEADVEVLFVIPKLRGGEKAHGTTFINASSIPIRERRMIANDGDSSPSPLDDAPYYQSRENIISKTGGRRITLEVPALLTPYQAPSKTVSAGLEKWN